MNLVAIRFLIAKSKVSWDQKFHETKNLADPWCYFWFNFYDILVKKITTTILSFHFFFSHDNNILIEEFLCIVFFFSLATSWIEYLIVIVYDRNCVSVLGWNRTPMLLSFGFGITYSISSFFSAGQGWTSCFDFCLSFLFIYQRISYESEQHRNSSSMKCWSKTGSK